MASEKTPRSIRTTDGSWISRKTAERLYRRGRAKWHGPLIELISPLALAELNRSLGLTATLKHSPVSLPIASPRTNAHWSDLRAALPVRPGAPSGM